MVAIALTIAGSDPCGGAGLQADLKTFHTFGVYGASAVSLVTVQDTTSVREVEVLSPRLVAAQIAVVLGDLAVSAAKTGALGSAAVVDAVVDSLASSAVPLVVDPVMISKHGAPLLDAAAVVALRERLLPRALLVTPNAPEAEALAARPVRDVREARDAARAIADLGARNVLVKGGHLEGPLAVDVLLVDGVLHELSRPRIASRAGHGTGCSLSAAITACVARGEPLFDAVVKAKAWLSDALATAEPVGHGVGPVNHFAPAPRLTLASSG